MSSSDKGFTELLTSHGKFIANTLRIYERNQSIRDELYQDVALALWRALPSFRGDASIRTFIARITHNIGVSHVRKSVRRPPTSELDETLKSDMQSPEYEAQINDRRRLMMSCLQGLRVGHRQVLALYLEDFSQREMSEILGLTEGNIAVRLTRARAALTQSMETYTHEYN